MRGRSKKILIGILSILVILGVVYTVALLRSKAQLHEAYATLRRDGRPMRASDVTPPDIPEEQNAAALYERAIAMLTVPLPNTAEKDLLERLGRFSRVIFDEPTAALDTLTEKTIFDALPAVVNGKTLFVASHRPSIIKDADRIFLLDKTRIVAVGTHQSLLKSNDYYRSLMTG